MSTWKAHEQCGKKISKISVEMYEQSGKRGFEGSGVYWREKGGGRDVEQGRVDPLRITASPVDADRGEKKLEIKWN